MAEDHSEVKSRGRRKTDGWRESRYLVGRKVLVQGGNHSTRGNRGRITHDKIAPHRVCFFEKR